MSSVCVPKIPKGLVLLLCFYDGTPIAVTASKELYPKLCQKIKEGAKIMIDGMLQDGCTKEEIAECIKTQQDNLHNKILSVAKFVSDDILEKAWGADWKMVEIEWMVNIACLLRLKCIKNDEMNGWSLHDHNSVRSSMDDGDVACVFGKAEDMTKLLKKAKSMMKDIQAKTHKKSI